MDNKEVKEVKKRKPRVKKAPKKQRAKKQRVSKKRTLGKASGLLGDLGLLSPLQPDLKTLIKTGLANQQFLGMPAKGGSLYSKVPTGFGGLYKEEVKAVRPDEKGTIEELKKLKDELKEYKQHVKIYSPEESMANINEIQTYLNKLFRGVDRDTILKYLNRFIGIADDTNDLSLLKILEGTYKTKSKLIEALAGYFDVGMYGLDYDKFYMYARNKDPKNLNTQLKMGLTQIEEGIKFKENETLSSPDITEDVNKLNNIGIAGGDDDDGDF